MSWGKPLFVWESATGAVEIAQEGGVDPDVIGQYEDLGKSARFFDAPLNIGDVYVHRDQLRERPQLMARLQKREIYAGVEEAKIFGVPHGAAVHITDGVTGFDMIADGGIIHLIVPAPGLWTITIDAFPCMPQRLELIAK